MSRIEPVLADEASHGKSSTPERNPILGDLFHCDHRISPSLSSVEENRPDEIFYAVKMTRIS
jgi:hypothetical protein